MIITMRLELIVFAPSPQPSPPMGARVNHFAPLDNFLRLKFTLLFTSQIRS